MIQMRDMPSYELANALPTTHRKIIATITTSNKVTKQTTPTVSVSTGRTNSQPTQRLFPFLLFC